MALELASLARKELDEIERPPRAQRAAQPGRKRAERARVAGGRVEDGDPPTGLDPELVDERAGRVPGHGPLGPPRVPLVHHPPDPPSCAVRDVERPVWPDGHA